VVSEESAFVPSGVLPRTLEIGHQRIAYHFALTRASRDLLPIPPVADYFSAFATLVVERHADPTHFGPNLGGCRIPLFKILSSKTPKGGLLPWIRAAHNSPQCREFEKTPQGMAGQRVYPPIPLPPLGCTRLSPKGRSVVSWPSRHPPASLAILRYLAFSPGVAEAFKETP
jgi:hypothetical protein